MTKIKQARYFLCRQLDLFYTFVDIHVSTHSQQQKLNNKKIKLKKYSSVKNSQSMVVTLFAVQLTVLPFWFLPRTHYFNCVNLQA